MKTVHKSVLIWYSPKEMFDLVAAVDQYPKFLPWCDRARVIETDATGMKAEIGISFGGIRQSFITRNEHVEPSEIRIKLVSGPFSQLEGKWRFLPVGGAKDAPAKAGADAIVPDAAVAGGTAAPAGSMADRACRVELDLSYGFDNFALAAIVGPVFDRIAASMVDAFVKRAGQVYG